MSKHPKDRYSLGVAGSQKIAERIRARIRAAHMTQAAAAREAERASGRTLEASHLSELLAADGRRNFQSWHIQALAKALKCSERELVGGLVPEAAIVESEPSHRQSKTRHIEMDEENLAPGLTDYLELRSYELSEQDRDRLKRWSSKLRTGAGGGTEFWDGVLAMLRALPP